MQLDSATHSNTLRRKLRRISRSEIQEEAVAFIKQYYRENNLSSQAAAIRIKEVLKDLKKYDYYEHTPQELSFGAKVAWRNHARCIGRLHWRSLKVYDCRKLIDINDIAQRLIDHIDEAQGNGNIRSMISVFAPVKKDKIPAFIESRQLLQYAGYVRPGQATLGDPITLETTKILMSLGWRPPAKPTPFDLLPILLRDEAGQRHFLELPEDLVMQVPIQHPSESAIDSLGLKWYALPCVSSMILSIGGIDYPCAPFNGFYMGTEIASRNFSDERRYNLLPQIAQKVYKNSTTLPNLWKDHVLTLLNEAVLYSFQQQGITIIDHHTSSKQFMDFAQREKSRGRIPSGDWSWVVPPQASSSCPVFHLQMENRTEVPNFYYSRATDGDALRIYYDHEEHSKWWFRWKNMKRCWRRWRRSKSY